MLNSIKLNNFLILILSLVLFSGLNGMLKVNSRKFALFAKTIKSLGDNKKFWFKKGDKTKEDNFKISPNLINLNFPEEINKEASAISSKIKISEEDKNGVFYSRFHHYPFRISHMIALALTKKVKSAKDDETRYAYLQASTKDIEDILKRVDFYNLSEEHQVLFCNTGLPKFIEIEAIKYYSELFK